VFQNKVFWKIFKSRRDEVSEQFRKPQNKGLHDLYKLPSIARIVKCKRLQWNGCVARMEKERMYTGF
jgi:hypothetical protein